MYYGINRIALQTYQFNAFLTVYCGIDIINAHLTSVVWNFRIALQMYQFSFLYNNISDSDSVVSVKKRRKSASSTPRDQNRMGSPLLKPPLTERQQMALIMQMTDPQKHGAGTDYNMIVLL